jgi:hypothetical protein
VPPRKNCVVGDGAGKGKTGIVASMSIVMDPPELPVSVIVGIGSMDMIVPGLASIQNDNGEEAKPTRKTSPVEVLVPSGEMITVPPVGPWKNVPNSMPVARETAMGLGGSSCADEGIDIIIKHRAITTGNKYPGILFLNLLGIIMLKALIIFLNTHPYLKKGLICKFHC